MSTNCRYAFGYQFNHTAVMDLKIWDLKKGIYVFYLFDAATRLTKARTFRDKRTGTIIASIFIMCLADGPGAPKRFLSNNSTEFSDFAFQEMCELNNVVECKTAVK